MLSLSSYLLLGLAIVSEIAATSALKASHGMSRALPAIIVVCGYGVAFYLLALTLRTLPVGYVYALWSGLGVIGVALAGVLLYGEAFSLMKAGGMALIMAGVIVLNFHHG